MTLTQLGLVAFTIVSAVVSQVVFKSWVNSLGGLSISAEGMGRLVLKILSSPLMLAALLLYGLGFLAWIVLLSRSTLSLVYPVIVSLNIVAVLVLSAIVFHEQMNLSQLIGILVVLLGIFLVFRA